jgi:hypothetical protein
VRRICGEVDHNAAGRDDDHDDRDRGAAKRYGDDAVLVWLRGVMRRCRVERLIETQAQVMTMGASERDDADRQGTGTRSGWWWECRVRVGRDGAVAVVVGP